MFNPLFFSKNYNENSFFLDTYSGAAGAWSMRSIKASTLSSAVYRIRRTVTAGTADVFLDVNGLVSLDSPITIITGTSLATNLGQYVAAVGYSDVDGLLTPASAFCSIWYDTSGNGKNAIQNTDASQPRLVNAGVLDKDPYTNRTSLYFSGSNELSIASFNTNLSVLNSHSVFTVHKNLHYPVGSNSVFRSSISTTNRFAINYLNVSGLRPLSFQAYNGSFFTKTTNVGVNQSILTSCFFTPNTMDSFVNTTASADTIRTGGTDATATTTIGNTFIGYISEIIVYPSNISANRTAMETILLTFFNLP